MLLLSQKKKKKGVRIMNNEAKCFLLEKFYMWQHLTELMPKKSGSF